MPLSDSCRVIAGVIPRKKDRNSIFEETNIHDIHHVPLSEKKIVNVKSSFARYFWTWHERWSPSYLCSIMTLKQTLLGMRTNPFKLRTGDNEICVLPSTFFKQTALLYWRTGNNSPEADRLHGYRNRAFRGGYSGHSAKIQTLPQYGGSVWYTSDKIHPQREWYQFRLYEKSGTWPFPL